MNSGTRKLSRTAVRQSNSNFDLAQLLGKCLNQAMKPKLYKIAFYVPVSHVEAVKSALFAAGAGRYENYDCCSWQTLGEGQFRPLKGSQPSLGKEGVVEKVSEYKVEMVCREDLLAAAKKSLLDSHPYEEPAYEIYLINP